MNIKVTIILILWVVFLLFIIHNSMKIIKKIQETFQLGEPVTEQEEEESSSEDATCSDNTCETRELVIKFRNLVTSIHRLSDLSPEQQTRIFTTVRTEARQLNIRILDIIFNSNLELIIDIIDTVGEESANRLIERIETTFRDYSCASNRCPLASILTENPEVEEKWGDNVGECVKVLNETEGSCARCPPGTFIDYSNITEICTPCPQNTYTDKFNSSKCLPCPGQPQGSDRCPTARQDTCENTTTNNFTTMNLLSPDVENRDLLERIYDNNIRKFKQNEVINYRINRMKQKLADYTDL